MNKRTLKTQLNLSTLIMHELEGLDVIQFKWHDSSFNLKTAFAARFINACRAGQSMACNTNEQHKIIKTQSDDLQQNNTNNNQHERVAYICWNNQEGIKRLVPFDKVVKAFTPTAPRDIR